VKFSTITCILVSENNAFLSSKKIKVTSSYRKVYGDKMAAIADNLRSGPKIYVSITNTYQTFYFNTKI
jgi:hypothetical protein